MQFYLVKFYRFSDNTEVDKRRIEAVYYNAMRLSPCKKNVQDYFSPWKLNFLMNPQVSQVRLVIPIMAESSTSMRLSEQLLHFKSQN